MEHDFSHFHNNRSYANRRVQMHHDLLALQKKSLEVSSPEDAQEKEADNVSRKVANGESAAIGESGNNGVNRKGEGTAEASPEFRAKLESSKGSGQSLPGDVQHEMGRKMGTDFSRVKVHTGNEAHAMNEEVNAKAFTHGQDVYFKNGNYDTKSKEGKELLAHELVHTKQQGNGLQRKIQRSTGHEPGKDYSKGNIRAEGKTYLMNDNLKTDELQDKKYQLYFVKGDAVTLKGTKGLWVKVEGTAHYIVGKTTTDVTGATGWVKRSDTDMTLGMFSDLNVSDYRDVSDYSKMASFSTGAELPAANVKGIILHQTGGASVSSAMNAWNAKKDRSIHVAANYIIGPDGNIMLVVPVNEVINHAPHNKHIKVTPPKSSSASDMAPARKSIEEFYSGMSVGKMISKYMHDYLLAMSDKDLYDYLKANNWEIYNPDLTNRKTIGIEVTTSPTVLYQRTFFESTFSNANWRALTTTIDNLVSAGDLTQEQGNKALKKDEIDTITKSTDKKLYPNDATKATAIKAVEADAYSALAKKGWRIGSISIYKSDASPGQRYADVKKSGRWNEFYAKVSALNFSPELKEQILQTKVRADIEAKLKTATDEKVKTELNNQLDKMNEKLYDFFENRWGGANFTVYQDIGGAQKYSMWLLVKDLATNFNLADMKKQVVGHQDIGSKQLGEGQNQAEFIRDMVDFTGNMKTMQDMYNIAVPTEKANLMEKWQYYYDVMTSIDNKADYNSGKNLKDFFDNFYERIDTFNNSGAIGLIKIFRNIK